MTQPFTARVKVDFRAGYLLCTLPSGNNWDRYYRIGLVGPNVMQLAAARCSLELIGVTMELSNLFAWDSRRIEDEDDGI